MRAILCFGVLCAGAACGNVTDNKPVDAAMPDAPSPTIYRWVVDKQRIPTTNAEATQLGLDLNGDGVVDNQLGAVLAAFSAQGFNQQGTVDTAISRGTILMLGEASVGGADPMTATFTMYTGADPQPAPCNGATDVVCRHHLDGNGRFGIAATSAHDPPLVGTIANGTLLAGPGHLQVSLVVPDAAPVVLDLLGARVRLQSVAAASLGQSVIAGAVTAAQRDTRVYPAMQQSMSARVALDCPSMNPPSCGCAAGSSGATILNLFDTSPKDCKVSIAEVTNNTLIKSLFAPDLTIEGQAAISLGFEITAVKGTFTP